MLGSKINKIISDFSKSDKKIKILALIGIIGIILILLSEISPSADKTQSSKKTENFSYADYTEELESKTEEMISSINGAGKCRVMITLKNTRESVFAKNSQESGGDSSYSQNFEYVLYDGQDGESPVLIKEYFPEIQGIAVVCEGADNETVRENVIKCVSALYNISISKISVLKGGKFEKGYQ